MEKQNKCNPISENDLIEARKLIPMLSRKRSSDYGLWYQIGECLHNIDNRLLDDWIKMCENENNSIKNECTELWNKFKSSNYTIQTLRYFASIDNPDFYQKMIDEIIDKVMTDRNADHKTFAKLIMTKYEFRFKYTSIYHKQWYEFVNHKWTEIDCNTRFREIINDELIKHFEKKQYVNDAELISKNISRLNHTRFKAGIIRECANIAFDPSFIKKLDKNTNLICFTNGIYDLEADVFRDGCPEDEISLCIGYDYVNFDRKNPCFNEIKSFFEKIQPDATMRDYLLTLLSTCLDCSNSKENFYIFTERDAIGTTKLLELMKYTMGDLFKAMDTQLLIKKKKYYFVDILQNIRVCSFGELSTTIKLDTNLIKLFTKPDIQTYTSTELVHYRRHIKPFLICNPDNLPLIDTCDVGNDINIKIIPFPNQFPKEDQFWNDIHLSEKLFEWKQMFMYILIWYYKKYRVNGLVCPKLVVKETDRYLKKYTIVRNIIKNKIVRINQITNYGVCQNIIQDRSIKTIILVIYLMIAMSIPSK